ncbi:uncharacterized protein LOC111932620 [Cyanistes caeruleus]|uniref:uncharacterized protein LOC111932620 n=1 Tax=Cyanistes caeruleus TaxID=156563 RepID=UPI000CDB8E71|nr:uncharacterized protein LOC111932620 [Cyanistes caeruleus]
MDKESSTDTKPKKTLLMFRRRQKIPNSESWAAAEEAEEHHDSRAAPGMQAAAAESREAAPHSPGACCPALLHSLQRGSRAILSRVAATIRRCSQQPGTQKSGSHLHRATEAVSAAAAPAARAERWAQASHSPCCPLTALPSPPGAVGGQGAGAAVGTVLETSGHEKVCFSLEPDWEWDSPRELSQEEYDPEQGCSSGEVRSPVRPHEAWAEHWNLPSCSAAGQASASPGRALPSWEEDSISETMLAGLPPSPSPRQVEARRQWAIAAARILLPGLQNVEEDASEEGEASSSGDESDYMSCNYEPSHLEPCKGRGLLELSPQTRDEPAAKWEDRSTEELSDKRNVITIHTIWVNPRYPQLLMDPDLLLEEEEDAELPSTSHALAAPGDTQPAGAAPAGGSEDKEHPVHTTAQP